MSDVHESFNLGKALEVHSVDAKACDVCGCLVSYIVLSYNHKNYIEKAINGIKNQTYKNIELIVVDDGSTDGSAELLHELQKSKKFKLIVQENSGVVAALNRGVSESAGDFVVPHASDDVSEADRTEKQLASFHGDGTIGFVVGGVRKISEFGEVLEPWHIENNEIFKFDDFIQGKARPIAVSCMYRGDLIRNILPLDAALPFEDVQLYWRITELGYSCLVDGSACVINYRILPGSLGRSNKLKLHFGFLKFIEQYKGHPDYQSALSRAKGGIFSEMAERAKTDAVKYYFLNSKHISLNDSIRGCVKILMPRFLIAKFKKKF